MKNKIYTISILAFLTCANAFGQKPVFELTFTAIIGGEAVMLDSINIENLTQGGDTTLYAPNNVLTLDFATGIGGNNENGTNSISLTQNYPNPFNSQTSVHLNVPEKDFIKIRIYDFIGREVANYSDNLDAGNHLLTFQAGKEKYYMFTATSSRETQSIKMMNISNSNTQAKLVYQGTVESTITLKSQKITNDFFFLPGDQLRFIGYAATLSGINGSDILQDIPQNSHEYQFEILEGIPCTGIPTITYEGQIYKTVQIGSQCWLRENLNVGTMISGNGDQTNNSAIEKYCFGDDPLNCNTYGGLYQWNEMMEYSNAPGTQGICPTGWHLPTDGEWCTLTTFMDPTVDCDEIGFIGINGAGKMKSTGISDEGTGLWFAPNAGAINSCGFTTLPGGFYDDFFLLKGEFGGFHSSSDTEIINSWTWSMYSLSQSLVRDNYSKNWGLSVRCIKN